MASSAGSDRHDPAFDELRHEYERGRLIVFAGAGVSAAAGLPSWEGLVELLMKRAAARQAAPETLAEIAETAQKQQFIEALSAAKDALGAVEFCSVVEQHLNDKDVTESEVARAIAALAPNLRAVLTTNLDHLLEKAFGGRWPTLQRATADLPSRGQYILKLHGTLLERASWVLTREQYDHAMYADSKLAQTFTALFHTHPILFVGYGLADEDFDALLGRVRAFAGEQPPRHFALVDAATVKPGKRKRVESAGVRLLLYENADGKHTEVVSILRSLRPPSSAVVGDVTQGEANVAAPGPSTVRARLAPEPQEVRAAGISRTPPPPSAGPPLPARGDSSPSIAPASATPPPLRRPRWGWALAAGAGFLSALLLVGGISRLRPRQTRDIKIGMSWFPFTANDDKDNPLVRLLADSMKCEANEANSPINIDADFGSSYQDLVKRLVSGEYSFALVPPFTFLQCMQGETTEYHGGECLDLKLDPDERARLARCNVIGQRLRSGSGMSKVEQWSYRPVLIANLAFKELIEKSEGGALDWQLLRSKTILFGSPLSTSSNLIPRLMLAENGLDQVTIMEGLDRRKTIEMLRSDDQGKYVAFMADDDFQRGGFGAPELKVIPLDRRIPFDPVVACQNGSPDDMQTRARVLDKMERVGLVRRAEAWNYPVFARYIYTAPLGPALANGHPAFAFPFAWADRRGLRNAFEPQHDAKVLRFEFDGDPSQGMTERPVGGAKIDKRDLEHNRGEAIVSADVLKACSQPRGTCHLDVGP